MSKGEERAAPEGGHPGQPKADLEALVLRARPGRAVRFKRGVAAA